MSENLAAALIDAVRMMRNEPTPPRETPAKRRKRLDDIIARACEPYGIEPDDLRKALQEAFR